MPHETYTTKAPCYANIVSLYLIISFVFLNIQLKRQIKHLINLIFCVNFGCVLLLTSEQTLEFTFSTPCCLHFDFYLIKVEIP